MTYIYLTLLLAIGLGAQDPDHWHSQMMLGEMAACGLLSYEINKVSGKIPALAFLYFSVYAVYCCFAKTNFSVPGKDIQGWFDGATSRSLCFLLLVTIPFIFTKKYDLNKWLTAFKIFAIVDCLYMFYSYLFCLEPNGWRGATGMIGMDSVDGTFLCLILPSFIYSKNLDKIDKNLCLISIFCALILTRSSTVFGIVCLYGVIAAFKWKKWTAVIPVLAAYPVGKFVLGKDLLLSNGRDHVLKLSLAVFKNVFNTSTLLEKFRVILFGIGQSSWLVTMPIVQGTNHTFFPWMHDEPAQVMWEQGLVGLSLLTAVYLFILWKHRKNTCWTMTILGMGLQSFLQPSFRYFLFAMFLIFVVRLAYSTETNFKEEILI